LPAPPVVRAPITGNIASKRQTSAVILEPALAFMRPSPLSVPKSA
jgi:hypothetical protein